MKGLTAKEKLIKELKIETGDAEHDHVRADTLLLEYINDKEISEAFNSVFKWYE